MLDAAGVIVSVNRAWQRFSEANGLLDGRQLGHNYLQHHTTVAAVRGDHRRLRVLAGIGDVLFHGTRPPTCGELATVVLEVETQMRHWLKRRADRAHATSEEPSAEALRARAVLSRLAQVRPAAERTPSAQAKGVNRLARKPPLVARSPAGYDLHAGVTASTFARPSLEKLLRYLARPAVPESRLRHLRNGNVAVDLKRQWARGTTSVEFEPLAFIARLAALMPPPGMKLDPLEFIGVDRQKGISPLSGWSSVFEG